MGEAAVVADFPETTLGGQVPGVGKVVDYIFILEGQSHRAQGHGDGQFVEIRNAHFIQAEIIPLPQECGRLRDILKIAPHHHDLAARIKIALGNLLAHVHSEGELGVVRGAAFADGQELVGRQVGESLYNPAVPGYLDFLHCGGIPQSKFNIQAVLGKAAALPGNFGGLPDGGAANGGTYPHPAADRGSVAVGAGKLQVDPMIAVTVILIEEIVLSGIGHEEIEIPIQVIIGPGASPGRSSVKGQLHVPNAFKAAILIVMI